MKARCRIGLVLSSVPGYSETFFRNKIRGLQDQGVTVVLFTTEKQNNTESVLGCKIVQACDFGGFQIKVVVTSVLVLLKTVLLSPKRSYRHYQLDRLGGFSFMTCIKRLIQNGFLFSETLDWLHFGFGMLAVGRENVAQSVGAKMAVSFRGFDLYLSPLKHPNCYELLFKTSCRYHVLSQEMKRDLMDVGISKEVIEVITPAIDVQFFKLPFKPLENKNNDTIKLVTVARLHWKKGLVYTLEALAILKRQGVSFTYTIIGEGEEYERLVFAAHQLGILENITFTGRLKPEYVRNHLEHADVYIQYSIQEGFCNAVLEAQAMGLLCIVSNAEGLAENVLHNKTGWIVPKRQPDLLANQIRSVINLPNESKQSISAHAVSRVQQHFNLKNQQNAFLEFYDLKLE